MSFEVVSWYTPDYELCNERLIRSLEEHGHRAYTCWPVIPVGKWGSNVRYFKPWCLAKALQECEGDFLYLDSDAVVNSRMTLFDDWTGEDIGVHYRGGRELLGGTVYVKPSARVHLLLSEISSFMESSGLVWQQAAQLTLQRHPEISVKRLPPEYCCIFDSMRTQHPGIVPVIEHMQYSRQVRH